MTKRQIISTFTDLTAAYQHDSAALAAIQSASEAFLLVEAEAIREKNRKAAARRETK